MSTLRVGRSALFLLALCIPLAGLAVASPVAQAAIEPISTSALPNAPKGVATALSKDGRHVLFSAGLDSARYSVTTGVALPAPDAVDMSGDGRWLASISSDRGTLAFASAFGSDRTTLGYSVVADVAISRDGSKVAYVGHPNSRIQAYLWARDTDATTTLDDGIQGTATNEGMNSVSLSADGRFVAYQYVDFLAGCHPAGIPLCQFDAWRYDTATGARSLISAGSSGVPLHTLVGPPVLSGNGNVATFSAREAGDGDSVHVYRKDLDSGELRDIATYPFTGYYQMATPSISDDGDRIAYWTHEGRFSPSYVYERSSDSTVRLTLRGGWQPVISGDGETVIYGEDIDALEPRAMMALLPGTSAARVAAVPAKTSITVPLVGGSNEVKATVLNVTIVGPEAAGYATVWPCDEPRPNTSNLNFLAGQTVANAVIMKPSKQSTICVYTDVAADILVDQTGYLSTGNSFVGQNPSRVLDTRDPNPAPGLDAGVVARVGPLNAEADSVVLNVTATNASAAGFVTAWPCDQPRPNASSVNFVSGTSVPNLVIAKTSADHTVCLYTDHPVDLIADLSGWFRAGNGYHGLTPVRTFDSRKPGSGPQLVDRPTYSGVATVEPDVRVPADASAVVLNLTATNPAEPGFGSASTCSGLPPRTSNLNFVAGQTVPNLVVTRPSSPDRTVCLFSSTPIDYIVDNLGYFPAGSGYVAITPVRLADTRSS
jgi:hypothetical protein